MLDRRGAEVGSPEGMGQVPQRTRAMCRSTRRRMQPRPRGASRQGGELFRCGAVGDLAVDQLGQTGIGFDPDGECGRCPQASCDGDVSLHAESAVGADHVCSGVGKLLRHLFPGWIPSSSGPCPCRNRRPSRRQPGGLWHALRPTASRASSRSDMVSTTSASAPAAARAAACSVNAARISSSVTSSGHQHLAGRPDGSEDHRRGARRRPGKCAHRRR